MKRQLTLLSLALLMFYPLTGVAQKKVKYSKAEVKEMKTHFFNEGFNMPSRKKTSTIITKDGETYKGYCRNIKRKKGQLHTISLIDSITKEKFQFNAGEVAEMYLYATGFEKGLKFADHMTNLRSLETKSMSNIPTDRTYFVSQTVSLKNKKDDREFLMQLINPEFSQIISIYHDPRASESGGMVVGGMQMGGGVLKSYYAKKGDDVFWLTKRNLDEHYDLLFGDNEEFVTKYPANSIHWDWLSFLVLKYTEMSMGEE